jgi:hypothetical protein
MPKIRVISLYQPYATLVVLGEKKFETRSWDTNCRGPLLIHATVGFPKWAREACYQEPFKSVLGQYGYNALNLPKGQIIGQVELVNTVRSDLWIAGRMEGEGEDADIEAEWMNEFQFGDYTGGRFAWELTNPVRFAEPIPAKGSQGFWSYELPTLIA